MKDLIYYPRFESRDKKWLKYAILYLDNFIPIIPQSGGIYLSENYKRIMGETDLIRPYEPKYSQGQRATQKAIDEVETILRDEHRKSVLFDAANVKRKMQNSKNWNETLFNEKYTNDWKYFCLENGIGIENYQGLLISQELALIYMTSLAQEIAFEEDTSTITDIKKWDNYTTFKRVKSPKISNKINLAKSVIDIRLPADLETISFQKLIEFRTKNRKFLSAFVDQINKLYDFIGQGLTAQEFVKEHQGIYKDYTKEVLSLGLRMSSFPLAAWILMDNSALEIQYAKEILAALGVSVGGVYALKKGYKNLEGKRYCRKYLSNLKSIVQE